MNGAAIPGYMAAMTMTHRVSDPRLLNGLNPTDKIGFTIDPANNTIHENRGAAARALEPRSSSWDSL